MALLVLGGTFLLLVGYGFYYWHQNATRGVKAPFAKALLRLFTEAPLDFLVVLIILTILLVVIIKTGAEVLSN